MEERLAAEGFVRIHRSRLVNLDRIKELRLLFKGESVVVLKSETIHRSRRLALWANGMPGSPGVVHVMVSVSQSQTTRPLLGSFMLNPT